MNILKLALFFSGTVLLNISCTTSSSKNNSVVEVKKPNILFIMVDDLGKEWISAYGAESISTPAIDNMTSEGMKFHNAWSMPQCTPTRTTLLTGKYPWKHGWVNHWDVPRWGHAYFDWKKNKTFARYMKEAGYKTAAAGKWQINDFRITPDAMTKHGFDDWLMWTGYEAGVKESSERYWNPYIHNTKGSRAYKGKFGPDMFTDFLIDFMKKNKEHPMMMYYPMVLTHGPLTTTPDELNAKGKDRHKSMVRYTDKMVKNLLSAIDDLGLTDNTMIIFTTDNGTSGAIKGRLNGKLIRGGKATKWERGVCEPFIVKWPGKINAGSESYALMDFTDLLPTFLDMAGIECDDSEVDGTSILPVLLGAKKETSRDWIMALGHGAACLDDEGIRGVNDFADRVIRNKEYKAWTGHSSGIIALYNLINDPFEAHNLLGNLSKKDKKALREFEKVFAEIPKTDARPQYIKRESNLWDIKNLKCK